MMSMRAMNMALIPPPPPSSSQSSSPKFHSPGRALRGSSGSLSLQSPALYSAIPISMQYHPTLPFFSADLPLLLSPSSRLEFLPLLSSSCLSPSEGSGSMMRSGNAASR
eukprot:383715-Hanusia_phi.AAC.1